MATSPLCRLLVQVTANLREEQLEFGIGSEAATIHPLDENSAIMATACGGSTSSAERIVSVKL